MIQTILFDFDGTLFDTGEGILRSVQYALEGFGIHETDTARLRKFVGPPLFDSFTELYGMQPAPGALPAHRRVRVRDLFRHPGAAETAARGRISRCGRNREAHAAGAHDPAAFRYGAAV